MQTPGWYLNRLSRMSPSEVAYRVRTSVLARLERLGLAGAGRVPEPRPTAVVPWVYADDSADEALLRDSADRILENRYPVFALAEGLDGAETNWNRDPLTGTVAPLAFGKTLDYRSESIVGNIKYLWEPNRHLELVTLAQAYRACGDIRYVEGIRDRISSWFDQCPYQMGPNWSSSLELGIRLINWSIVWSLLCGDESPLFDFDGGERLRARWLESVYQHVHFIDGHYSRFSSANNHVIGEAAGVYIAGSFWPHWDAVEKARLRAREILLSESQKQTFPDGVNKEQAISYQQFVLDFLLFSALAGERCLSEPFPDDYWGRIEGMADYLAAVMDVGGNVPMIGDADDGYVTRLAIGEFCPYRSLLATAAIRFRRPDLAVKAASADSKTRSLVGPGADDALAELAREQEPDRGGKWSFPAGGYYLLGENVNDAGEIKLIVDCGPLGFLSIAAHGHADALSIVLSVAGREILVDPGTYSYHTDRSWREYFRGTGAHNTVRVDGQDQSVQGGNFMWLRHANARCIEYEQGPDGTRFDGEHDGYTRLGDPVVHRRQLIQHGSTIQVSDILSCNGYHAVERCWHFSEHCHVSCEGDSTIVAESGPVRVRLQAQESVDNVRHVRGSEDPQGGWISRRFDVKEPVDSVYVCNDIEGPTTLVTRIECEITHDDRRRDAGDQNEKQEK